MKSLEIVTLHDARPSLSSRTFKIIEELEKLEIRYNIGLVPFFNEKRDLPRVLRFVDKIKSCKGEIVLHGLCHENSRHQIDTSPAEQEIRAGPQRSLCYCKCVLAPKGTTKIICRFLP